MKTILHIFLFVVVCCQPIHASHEVRSNILDGIHFLPEVSNPLQPQVDDLGNSIIPAVLTIDLQDLGFSASGGAPSDLMIKKILNSIQLFYNEDTPHYMDFDWSLEVTMDLNVITLSGPQLTQNLTLKIDFKHGASETEVISFKQTDLYAFKDAIKIELKMVSSIPTMGTSASGIPAAQQIERIAQSVGIKAEIAMESYKAIDYEERLCQQDFTVSYESCGLKIDWTPINGAEEYDLEYTFSPGDVYIGGAESRFSFDNATRVQLTETHYNIPLVYEYGYILWRVRGIGRNPDDLDKIVVGAWSCGDGCSGSCNDTNIPTWEYTQKAPVTPPGSGTPLTGHMQDKMNWQITTYFAEEGKRKDVVTYFDGTMRTRQTLTGLSTEQMTLVGEQYYDHIGRAAVEPLPVPVADYCLNFKPALNTNESGLPYSWKDFEKDVPECKIKAGPMSNNSGVSQYYSPNNPFLTGAPEDFNANIPNAFEYPFTHRRFTNDNTNRIARQGGLGDLFQLGNGYETRFYYGVASNAELDPLFGNEVGIGKRYRQNMTVDPNGQVSLTYLDAAGNTIATCLAGESPDNVIQLDNYQNPVQISVDLLEYNLIDTLNYSMTLERPFLVNTPGTYDFEYELKYDQLNVQDCLPYICYDCIYDLEILLINPDKCNDTIYHHFETIGQLFLRDANGELVLDDQNIPKLNLSQCNNNSTTYLLSFQTPAMLDIGSYTIIKRLRVSESAADAIAENFINNPNNQCLKTIFEFIDAEIANIDLSGCNIDCDDAVEQDMVEFCDESVNPCENARIAMLNDMSPYGQYGDFSLDPTTLINDYPVSIYNPTNKLKTDATGMITLAYWKNGGNINVAPYQPWADINGTLVDPQTLPLNEFTTYFDDNWAENLLKFHPEYCYYKTCVKVLDTPPPSETSSSIDFDNLMLTSNTMAKVTANGFNPTSSFDPVQDVFKKDPFFKTSEGTVLKQEMEIAIIAFTSDGSGGTLSMFEVAYRSVVCPDNFTSCTSTPQFSTIDPGEAYNVWVAFRALYKSKKDEFIERMYKEKAIDNDCYNGCIGDPAFNPIDHDFSAEWQNKIQHCSSLKYHYFSTKQKRFPNVNDATRSGMNAYTSDPSELMDIANASMGNMPPSLDEMCGECDIVPHLLSFFEQIYGQPISNQPLNTLTSNTELQSYWTSNPDVAAAKVPQSLSPFSTDAFRIIITSPGGVDIKYYLEYDGSLNITDLCCFRPQYNPSSFAALNDASFYSVTATLSNGSTTELELAVETTNPKYVLDCIVPRCPPDQNCSDLKDLFNHLLAEDKFNQPHFIPQAEIGGSLIVAEAPRNGLQWTPQSSTAAPGIIANLGGGNTNCEIRINLNTQAEAFQFLNILELVPDPTIRNNDGYTYHFIIKARMADFSIRTFRGSSDCFVMSYCCSVPASGPGIGGAPIQPDNLSDAFADAINNPNPNPTTTGPALDFNNSLIRKDKPYTSHAYCPDCETITLTSPLIYIDEDNCFGPFCDTSGEKPIEFTIEVDDNCIKDLMNLAMFNAEEKYWQYIDSVKAEIKKAYMDKCLAATETFLMKYDDSRYHFTLYFYNQAGNLVKTVPPKGVNPITDATDLKQIKDHRIDPDNVAAFYPAHSMVSQYTFNTTNQIIEENIPDRDGPTEIFYDRLDRPVAAQDARQAGEGKYSYTLFDELGRAIEAGEIEQPQTLYQYTTKVDASWRNWLQAGTKREIVRTYYDELPDTFYPNYFEGWDRKNYRGRVAAATYWAEDDQSSDHNTIYHYDIQGNVNRLIQQGALVKEMRYDYDLISGNVNQLHYQPGQEDEFLHRYNYDADNRIIQVYTSPDSIIWDRDAYYHYYHHGPLARLELGENEVQGLDYVYNLSGWIKGINSGSLQAENDAGKDGHSGSQHANFGRDAIGYVLGYYNGDNPLTRKDYNPIASNSGFEPNYNGSTFDQQAKSSYVGNIRNMITAIKPFMDNGAPMGYMYEYDQLQRIKGMQSRLGFDDQNNNWLSNTGMAGYSSDYKYDRNGNITHLNRTGIDGSGIQRNMDQFTYTYEPGRNRLNHVSDAVAGNNFDNDIDNQAANNYTYDPIGNLETDISEGLDISWNHQGKVKEIQKSNGDIISFSYDALGNRIAKKVNNITTHYVLDAAGNLLSTYKKTTHAPLPGGQSSPASTVWESAYLYGANRLGEYRANKTISSAFEPHGGIDIGGISFPNASITNISATNDRIRGNRRYEMSNHLGNVLAVVSGRKLGVDDSGNNNNTPDGLIDYYEGDVLVAQDYYPSGMLMLEQRNFDIGENRFGFQGQEQDDEVKGKGNSVNYKYRMHDSRLGRFFAIDPLAKSYSYNSTYAFSENRLIDGVELEGA